MYITNPNAIARLFVAYDMCMENHWIQCSCELETEIDSLFVYPRGDEQNYLRFYNDSADEVRVAVYIDEFRSVSVYPYDYEYDLDKMLDYGRMMSECRHALYAMYDKIKQIGTTIQNRYSDVPYSVSLGMAFDKFITHSCDSVWDDEENGKLYFMIKGETLPNNYGYCLDYHDMTLCVVDNKGNNIIRRSASDLCLAFVNDRMYMLEV